MADDLKSIVQRMIDAGEPEENIATVIQSYKQPEAPAAEPSKIPPITAPGIMAMAGSAVKAGAPLVRKGIEKTAETIAAPGTVGNVSRRIIGGLVGGTVAAPVSAITGGMIPPWISGLAGFQFGHKMAGRGAKAVAGAASTEMPRVAGKFAALPAGRRAMNTVFGRAIPGVGNALTLADVGRLYEWLSEKGNNFAASVGGAFPNESMMTMDDILGPQDK